MSNKTLPEPAKKTASAPKRRFQTRHILFGVVLLMVLVLLTSYVLLIVRQGDTGCGIMISDKNQLDDPTQSPKNFSGPLYKCLQLERVSSPADLEKGLSGRKSMSEDQGMLFTFDSAGQRCFWMKDMNFPLDIIWLDANKKVVTVKENAQPSSYPESFCPEQPALYVIEVNAGVADRAYISEGSQLQF